RPLAGMISALFRRVAGSCRLRPDCSGGRLRRGSFSVGRRRGRVRPTVCQLALLRFGESFDYDLNTEGASRHGVKLERVFLNIFVRTPSGTTTVGERGGVLRLRKWLR